MSCIKIVISELYHWEKNSLVLNLKVSRLNGELREQINYGWNGKFQRELVNLFIQNELYKASH